MHFCQRNGKWTTSNIEILIDKKAFSEGSFRLAYHAKMYDNNMRFRRYICKFAKDANTPRDLYFNDIKAQVLASIWADRFNERNPPKLISVVECFVLELVERRGRPLCGCEELVEGDFKKHNNNVGAVATWVPETPEQKIDMELAQAFSHFTYAESQHRLLICDIQGVGVCYTDPQVHTISGRGFGGGNIGTTGIKAFLLRHQCNSMCAAMKLSRIEAKELNGQWTPDSASQIKDELDMFEDDSKRIYTKSRDRMTIGQRAPSRSNSPQLVVSGVSAQVSKPRTRMTIQAIPEVKATFDESIDFPDHDEDTKSANDDYENLGLDPEEEALMKSIMSTDVD